MDHYTDVSWIAFGSREPDEQVETEDMLFNDIDLPFVQGDDFNCYPERSPRVHGPSPVVVESPVLGKVVTVAEKEETARGIEKKERINFDLRRMARKVARRLGLKCLG